MALSNNEIDLFAPKMYCKTCDKRVNSSTEKAIIVNFLGGLYSVFCQKCSDNNFELVEKEYLVGASVYCRLIIENFINDLCRIKEIKLEDNTKLPQKLIELRKMGIIDLPTERLIQAKYYVGTYAVHGKEEFNKYSKKDILDLLNTTRDKVLTIK